MHFIKVLEPHDLDLQVAEDRLHGASLDALSVAYSITKDEARGRAIVGATKKTGTLGLFRGQKVDPNAPLDF